MHDSVGLQLGSTLQSAKLQLAILLQNCYFSLIQKTIYNSILWSLVIKYFWPACFRPLTCCARGQLPRSAPSVTPLPPTSVPSAVSTEAITTPPGTAPPPTVPPKPATTAPFPTTAPSPSTPTGLRVKYRHEHCAFLSCNYHVWH